MAYSVEKLALAVERKSLRLLREFPTKGAEGVHRWIVGLTQVVWLRLIATIEPIVGVIGQTTKIGRQREKEFFNRIDPKRPLKPLRYCPSIR